jgi:hypothetical protein
MDNKKQCGVTAGIAVLTILVMGILSVSYTPAINLLH